MRVDVACSIQGPLAMMWSWAAIKLKVSGTPACSLLRGTICTADKPCCSVLWVYLHVSATHYYKGCS